MALMIISTKIPDLSLPKKETDQSWVIQQEINRDHYSSQKTSNTLLYANLNLSYYKRESMSLHKGLLNFVHFLNNSYCRHSLEV